MLPTRWGAFLTTLAKINKINNLSEGTDSYMIQWYIANFESSYLFDLHSLKVLILAVRNCILMGA